MRVILLQDVDKVGKKYEVKNVSDGHARNFLIPKGFVKPATEEALEWLKIQKEILRKKAEEDLKKAEEQASAIDGMEVVIPVKVGDEGQLFESVASQKILEKLKFKGDIYAYEVWNVVEDNHAKVYIDITETFGMKKRVLKEFKSQMHFIYPLLPLVHLRARLYGKRYNCRYAEKFYKIK